jgi:hypothetical protein
MTSLLETISNALAIVFFVAIIATLGVQAVDRIEKQDCYKWQHYEREYPLFQIDSDTALRCGMLGIIINY